MTDNPKIIKVSVMYIFTMPFPPGPISTLVPPYESFRGEVEIYYCGDTYFAVTIQLSRRIRVTTEEEDRQEILKALDYIWGELASRELVTGSRPAVLEGNPLDMLPG